MTKEKDAQAPFAENAKPQRSRSRYLYTLLLLVPVHAWVNHQWTPFGAHRGGNKCASSNSLCAQVDALYPTKNTGLWDEVGDIVGTETFKSKAIEWLAGAVRVPTESYDGMDPVGVDPRWDAFGPFHDYLLGAFPQVHATLQLEKVNTWGLLYEWTGSDASLKPLLLAGHQDVVPVHPNTVSEWVHPPYSGYYDGELIWGRGSSDDKSGVIGILSALETLILKGFQPTRSIVLAFGFDEEISGTHGAAFLASRLLEKYGQNAFALVVDEGGGFTEVYGTPVATPGTAEKGYIDIKVAVAAPGGHSSVPPAHTSIGILSSLLVAIEANPYELKLTREDILYETLQCYAAHGKTVPPELRKAVKKAAHSDKGLRAIEDILFTELAYASLVKTTQAIDLIDGGVKTNALPEQAAAVVNHRISTRSSVKETQDHITTTLAPVAASFSLNFTAFGDVIASVPNAKGTLDLSPAFSHSLEPAPRTPTAGEDADAYRLLSGTIKAAFNAHRGYDVDTQEIVVSPGMPTGNTDTKYYWGLSPNIFRYNHKNSGNKVNRLGGAHTTNENIEVDAFLEMIRFFVALVLNADESEL
ncbi:carboxypeptidase S [Cylindrobasidium torrendii FP15055 ss-10]|uniref:Carboxypeptidase S n=1 Tax=Cylindrobasidium torrendii FP15055 ss-10 TaxID=1314674 RepID=A0A0D7B8T4_9AGAR|nr:carboxypeptidase S [Cylindrobasidium torrendii FP15055 ss-10]